MKKAIIAAVACGALLASQAMADTNSATVSLGDRVGADSSTSSDFEGMGNSTWIYFLIAAAAIGGAAYAISQNNNNSPASP
jgi:hypothetical protein